MVDPPELPPELPELLDPDPPPQPARPRVATATAATNVRRCIVDRPIHVCAPRSPERAVTHSWTSGVGEDISTVRPLDLLSQRPVRNIPGTGSACGMLIDRRTVIAPTRGLASGRPSPRTGAAMRSGGTGPRAASYTGMVGLDAMRETRGLTGVELARRTGLTPQTVSNI